MKTYTVFWHYFGNHGTYTRWANTPEEACRLVIRGFSDEFGRKAELVAIEGNHMMRPAEAYSEEAKVVARKGDWFYDVEGRCGIVLSRFVTNEDKRFIGRIHDQKFTRDIAVLRIREFTKPGDDREDVAAKCRDISQRASVSPGPMVTMQSTANEIMAWIRWNDRDYDGGDLDGSDAWDELARIVVDYRID